MLWMGRAFSEPCDATRVKRRSIVGAVAESRPDRRRHTSVGKADNLPVERPPGTAYIYLARRFAAPVGDPAREDPAAALRLLITQPRSTNRPVGIFSQPWK